MSFARRILSVVGAAVSPVLLPAQKYVDAATILLYHRVTDAHDPIYPGLTKAEFRAHCAVIAANLQVVPLKTIVECLASGAPLAGLCALTFDDGYYDFVDGALPSLLEFGLPCTHFVVAESLRTGRPPWTYRELRLRAAGAPTSIGSEIRAVRGANRDRLLLDLEVRTPGTTPLPKMLKTADLARVPSCVEWASHTCTHAYLPESSDAEIEHEARESREFLETAVGRPVSYFAYPDGRVDGRVVEIVSRCGYEAAFCVGQAKARSGGSCLLVPRLDVSYMPPAMFPLELSGVLERLRGARRAFARHVG